VVVLEDEADRLAAEAGEVFWVEGEGIGVAELD